MSAYKIATHVKSLINTTYEIGMENEVVSKPFFIRIGQYPAEPTILTYGANRKTKHQGIIQLDVITAIAIGQGEGQSVVDLILTSAPFGQYTTTDGFTFIIVKSFEMPAHLTPKDTSGKKYIKSVAIEYEYFA